MRVIFLDIDGVLNSGKFFAKESETRGSSMPFDEYVELFSGAVRKPLKSFDWADDMLDPKALERLDRIVMPKLDCRIVISSSWRQVHPLKSIVLFFEKAGLKSYGRVIDRTCSLGDRSTEILRFVEMHHQAIENWIAIDDMRLPKIPQEKHVKTTWADGLLDNHVEIARELLRRS